MKIYNKKGFIWGILWTIAGLFCLYRDWSAPHSFLPQQAKSVILSLLMLAIGITGFLRAFSQKFTQEDRTEALDERNRLVHLNCLASAGSILSWIQLAGMLAGIVGYALTKQIVFGFLFLLCGLNTTLYAILSIFFSIYYEKRL